MQGQVEDIYFGIYSGKKKTHSLGYIVANREHILKLVGLNRSYTVWDTSQHVEDTHSLRYIVGNRRHTVWDLSWPVEDIYVMVETTIW